MIQVEQKKLWIANSRHALDEYTIVANSFRYQQMFTNQLFFALVDFDEAQDVFQQVCYGFLPYNEFFLNHCFYQLKLNTAPVIMHFPAKGKPKRTDTMDIQRVGFAAEAVARWVGEQTEIQVSS